MPFLSLYIQTFGQFSDAYVQRWAGFVFGITFLTGFFLSPIWGRVSDKYGFKPILLITGYGIAACIFLMGFIRSVEGLFVLRLFQGVVTGFTPTALAFIASQTPKKIAGQTLGTLQMGSVSGGLFGPLIGGMLADSFGFQYTFIITASSIALAATLVAIGVYENRERVIEKRKQQYSRKEVLTYIFHKRTLLTVMSLTFIVQLALFSVQPLLALYVGQLTTSQNIAFLAGLAFSATGFGNLLFTRKWGQLGDSFGHERVLLILLLLASILFVPQAFVTSLWQLVLFRFLFGMVVGGIVPSITAYIRLVAPLSMQGEVLGYNVSFRFLGNVTGPILGGLVSGMIGISSVFLMTSVIFLFGFFLLRWSLRKTNESYLIQEQKGAS